TVTGQVYLDMLQTSIFPAIRELFGDRRFYLQQDAAPPHYHRDVRTYLDDTLTLTYALRETIEASCAAITPDTLTAVVRSAVRRL
ncbi:hypothetical protein B7P43_G14711, partial [Cryptotermes secundus]